MAIRILKVFDDSGSNSPKSQDYGGRLLCRLSFSRILELIFQPGVSLVWDVIGAFDHSSSAS